MTRRELKIIAIRDETRAALIEASKKDHIPNTILISPTAWEILTKIKEFIYLIDRTVRGEKPSRDRPEPG